MRWLVIILLVWPGAAMAMPPLLVAVAYGVAAAAGYIAITQAVVMIAITVYGAVSSREAARKARNQARDAYNATLEDRTVNIMSTTAPWQIVYGEAVVGGVVVTTLTSGDKDQFKHVVIVWAAHECDAITDFLINGVSVGTLDADGYVVSGDYYEGSTSVATRTVTLDAAGQATLTEDVPDGLLSEWLGWNRVVSLREASVEAGPVLGPTQATVSGNTLSVGADHVAAWAGKTVLVALDSGTGTARVRVRHHLGTPGQPADALTVAECYPDWTSNDQGRGLCYSVVRLDLNRQEFQGGPPQMTARVRGRKILDRRTGTTAWTDNNALCIDDFLQAEWGKRALASQVVESSVIATANACDEGLTLHPGEKRYTCNGAFKTDSNPDTTLNELCQSMAGFATYTGAWHLQAGVWTAPVMDLGDVQNAGSVEGVADESQLAAFNGVRGQFYDPERQNQLTDFAPYQNAAYVEADGEELWTPLNLPFTNTGWRAHNLARIHTERARGRTLVVPCKRIALKLRTGNRVRYSNSVLQMANAGFRVEKREYRLGQPVALTLAQDVESSYDEVDDPPEALESPAFYQANPYVVDPVEGLALESSTATLFKQADGSIVSRVKVSCTASEDTLVLNGGALQIEYRRDVDDAWQRAPEASGAGTQAYLLGLEEGRLYIVRARWRNGIGVSSDWRSAAVMHLGKLLKPAGVAGLAAVVVPGGMRITRTPSTELDFARTVYRYGASWEAGTPVPGTGDEKGCWWPWPPVGTYVIWAADVDRSGLRGDPVSYGPVTVTAAELAPANAALSIVLNVADFGGTVNYNEAYIHGRDSSGAAIDAPGAILVNGVALPVPNGNLYTNMGPVAGYIVWDAAGTTFTTGPGLRPYVLARRYQGQWQYDDNATGWVTFTPAATHWIIGTLESGAGDVGAPGSPPGLTAGSIWASASTLNSLEANADAAYAQAVAAATVSLIGDGGMTIVGNTAQKTGGGATWNASVRSRDSFTGGAFVSWVNPDVSYSFGFGLNTDPTTNPSYDTIDFWLYNTTAGTLDVFNSGTRVAAGVGTAASGDVLAVTYDGSVVRYLKNGTVLYEQAATVSAPLFLDSSFDTVGGRATNIQCGPLSSIAPALAAAATAQSTANGAATNASSALSTLATMRSNGYIDAAEKPALIKAWQAINDEFIGVYNQGSAYGLGTLRNAYEAAYYALQTYLAGLSPSWSDTSTDTPITPAVDQAAWASYYSTRQALLNGIAEEAGKRATWVGVAGRPKSYRVGAIGLSATGYPIDSNLFDADTGANLQGGGAMYRVVKIHRGTKVQSDLGVYNPLSGALGPLGECNAMAAALDGIDSAHVCVVYTYDEPATNRMLGGLPAAMYRNGASRAVWGSAAFSFRGAYILVGIGGCGEGNGAECYAGAVDSDTNAWCDTTFQITSLGALIVSGASRGVTTLLDIGYTGAPDATRNTIYRQASAPAYDAQGIWFDTDDNNKQYIGEGGSWVLVRDDGISAALTAAANAQSTADGKIQSYHQDTAPSGQGESEGDIWFDTNDGNKQYVYVTGVWVVAADTRIGDAILAAAGAQATANGRVSTFFASSAPTANAVGDLWFNTTDGRVKRWSGSSWATQSVIGAGDVGTDQLADQSATDVTVVIFAGITWNNTV